MVIVSKFAENLSALMAERCLNAPKLGKILKTDRTNITRYLKGERMPKFKGFVAMLEYFNVSADVLLGRTDYSPTEKFLPVQPFGVTLRRILEETDTSQYKIEKDLRISGATVYHWLVGKSLPSVENLNKLANFMEISVDYLLGRIK